MVLKDYAILEYIEGTGTQYINTDYIPKQTTSIKTKFLFTVSTKPTEYAGLFGTQNNDNNSDSMVGITNADGFGTKFGYGSYINFPSKWQQNIEYNLEMSFNKSILNDISYTGSNTWKDLKYPLTIFVRNSENGVLSTTLSKARIFSFKIYENDILIKDLVPVKRRIDNVVGLYDIVNQVFFNNKGTGNFIAGPEIDDISNYTRLEYIQSTGSQYINTNYKVNNTTTIDTKFSITQKAPSSNYDKLFGATDSNSNLFLQLDLPDTQYLISSYYKNDASGRIKSINQFSYNTIYQLKQDKNQLYIDGILQGTSSYTSSYTVSNNLYIFNCSNSSGTTGQPAYMKLYSFKIYDNDILVRNLVPVKRRTDDVVGLYDKVNNVFYINAGSGTFIAGPIAYTGSQLQQNIQQIQDEIIEINDICENILGGYIPPVPPEPPIPETYYQLEYLQSNRGQYIYPDYSPSGNTKIEMKFQNVESSGVYDMDMLFGDQHTNFAFGYHAGQWTYTCGKGEKKYNATFNTLYTLIFNDDEEHGILMNGIRYQSNTCTSVGAGSIRVFARNGAGYGLSKAKIYYMKIYKDGNLVKDLIPAKRKSDNVLGMYDKVSGSFYTNSGSGSFIAGPIIE